MRDEGNKLRLNVDQFFWAKLRNIAVVVQAIWVLNVASVAKLDIYNIL